MRGLIADFSVVIAIGSMSLIDFMIGLNTAKLHVPSSITPTSRPSWLISLFVNPLWSIPLAFPPALFGVILIFMDQQITTVIVNRKENKLTKSHGYHLDLCVLAILIGVCGVLGLPFLVAATVNSISHVQSLQKMSTCNAPGEAPRFLGCRYLSS